MGGANPGKVEFGLNKSHSSPRRVVRVWSMTQGTVSMARGGGALLGLIDDKSLFFTFLQLARIFTAYLTPDPSRSKPFFFYA